jgi:hypothetical protein
MNGPPAAGCPAPVSRLRDIIGQAQPLAAQEHATAGFISPTSPALRDRWFSPPDQPAIRQKVPEDLKKISGPGAKEVPNSGTEQTPTGGMARSGYVRCSRVTREHPAIPTLRRSLRLIRDRPPVRVQRAYGEAVDGIEHLIGNAAPIVGAIGEASLEQLTPTVADYAAWYRELTGILTALGQIAETFGQPDAPTALSQRGAGVDLDQVARIISLLQAAQQEPDGERQQHIRARIDTAVSNFIRPPRGPGSRGFEDRCDLALVETECRLRMIPALDQHGVPSVQALTELMREFKPWAGQVFTPSGGNEIVATATAQGIAYRLVGEVYGVKWTTVRDAVLISQGTARGFFVCPLSRRISATAGRGRAD